MMVSAQANLIIICFNTRAGQSVETYDIVGSSDLSEV